MKKLLGSTLAASAAMLGATAVGSGTANAEAAWSFNAGVATDYVFRGIDQTTPVSSGEVFGGADLSVDSFYAGIWLSSTGPNDIDNGLEYDLYAGWKPTVGGVNLDLGAIFYGYNDSDLGLVSSAYNYAELKAAASVPVGDVTLGAALYYAWDFNGSDTDAEYIEANAAYTFKNKATLSGAFGRQYLDENYWGVDGYNTGNVGVTYPITDNFSIDARYIAVEDDGNAVGYAQDKAVGTLKVTF